MIPRIDYSGDFLDGDENLMASLASHTEANELLVTRRVLEVRAQPGMENYQANAIPVVADYQPTPDPTGVKRGN